MAYIHAIAAGHLELTLYALSLFIGALPDGVLLLQKRGFGMKRRPGGIFRALGALVLVFLVGPMVLLVVIAYFVYGGFRGRRGR
jgi:hypothetical protein